MERIARIVTLFGLSTGCGVLLAVPLAVDPRAGDASLATREAALLLGGALALVLLLLAATIRGRCPVGFRGVDGALLALAALSLLSAAWAANPSAARWQGLSLLSGLGVCLAVRGAARSDGGFGRLRTLLTASGAILLAAAGLHRVLWEAWPTKNAFQAVALPDEEALIAGTATVGLLLSCTAFGPSARARWVGTVGLALSIALLFHRFDGSLLLPLAAGTVLFLALYPIARGLTSLLAGRRLAATLVLALCASGGAALVLAQQREDWSAWLKERFNRLVAASGLDYDRAYQWPQAWKAALEASSERPLLGHGAAQAEMVLPRVSAGEVLAPDAKGGAMQALCDLGIVGLLVYLALWLLALHHVATNTRSRALAVGPALVAVLLLSVFSSTLQSPLGLLFVAALIGLGSADPRSRLELDLSSRPWLRFLVFPLATVLLAAALPGTLDGVRRQAALAEASLLVESGRDDEAAEAYRRAARIGRADHRPHQQAGMLDLKARRYERALDEFRRAEALHPGLAILARQEGIAAFWLERYDAAANCFERALRLDPDDRDALRWRAHALLLGDRVDEAIEALLTPPPASPGRAVERSGSELSVLAEALFRRARRDHSVDDARRARSLYGQLLGRTADPDSVRERIAELDRWVAEELGSG